jgi:PAS domain S-box-containing protein
MNDPVRILLAEDSLADAELSTYEIRKVLPSSIMRRVDGREEFLAALSEFEPDIIISDYRMPSFDGMTALKLARSHAPMTPVIMVTGAINEDTAVECMKSGAADYVIKEHLKRLGQAVVGALEQRDLRRARLKAETDLLKSEERYRRFFEDDLSGIYLSTPRGELLACNAAFVRIMGYTDAEELKRTNAVRMYDDAGQRKEFLDLLATRGRIINYECELIRRDGSRINVLENVVGVFEEGQLVEFRGYLFDVTEQKKMDAAIRLLAHTTESIDEIITITGMDNCFTFVNDAFLRVYGYTREEVIGKPVNILWSPRNPPPLSDEILTTSREGPWRGEILNCTKDGREFPLSLRTSQVRDELGNVLGLVGVAEDITERKRADENLRSNLREKEALLREVHHRVKNNLQVISSLLHMQVARSNDESIRMALLASEHRIRSMALVHETLYQTNNFAAIDFGKHIHDLLHILTHSFGRPAIRTDIVTEQAELPIDSAVPCGLIVNELVTNALKHAFRDGREGTLAIALRRYGDTMLELSVEDDGTGFPADTDFRTMKSMGMSIINSLVEQIGGTISMDSSHGTKFVVRFPRG